MRSEKLKINFTQIFPKAIIRILKTKQRGLHRQRDQ